ncbi:serine/threonine-protein kinase MPS1 isoform X2 [Zootermopsis nevadensis]|uniref:serine/threonine-protein kinase MPS1 isoform X2 n=1 Tax=Zootermopsis nevadensis TaxID=136037 RepID=UPI000B8E5FEF|nr:serine/threonine-protein kinase MPS1 isoform X2 [Zootermopsis nevadensis]
MYGQYGQCGLLSVYDGDSSNSGSLSFPGATSNRKKKRGSLLGRMGRTTPPVRVLPLLKALKDMGKDERNYNTHDADDMPFMSLHSDLSHDGDDGATPKNNSFLYYSDKKNMDSESQLCSNAGVQLNWEMTDRSIIMEETQISNQFQHYNHHQMWSEEYENIVPESQAVDQTSEAYKTYKHINNPDKGSVISGREVSAHSEYPCSNIVSTNLQEERIVNTYDSGNSQDTLLGQKAKTVELFQEEVHGCDSKPDKDFLPSQSRDPIYSEYPCASSLSTNRQQEIIFNNCESSNNVDICLGQEVKKAEAFHEEVHNSSALCVKKEYEKMHMGPTVMCSSVKANRGIVLRNIINHKDVLNTRMNSVDVRGNSKIIPASDENLKQMDIKYVTNKENEIGLFASKTDAFNVTPARNNPLVNKNPIFGSNPVLLSKERGFEMSARKDISMQKQFDDRVESYTPFCNVNTVENTPLLDSIEQVKRKVQEDDRNFKLNCVGFITNKQNFQLPARKDITPENQILHSVAGRALSKINAMENATKLDVIPEEQAHQIEEVCSHSGSLNKSSSKTVQEYLTESKKELSVISAQGNNSVGKSFAAYEDSKMQQPVQSKSRFELVYKQDQNMALKSAQSQDNYITVNGKSYKVQKILGKGGSSQVFDVLDPNTRQELAMKCVNLSVAEPSIAQGYLNEIALLRRLQGSDTVICMTDFEYEEEKQMLYVVMEKGETDLSRLIKNISKTNQIPIITVLYYWNEMLRAVKNIHANGIIHSDLKPANFLLVSGRMKLIDFGIASSVQSDMTSVIKDAQAGTFNYMSPEAIQATHSTNGNQSGFKVTTHKASLI